MSSQVLLNPITVTLRGQQHKLLPGEVIADPVVQALVLEGGGYLVPPTAAALAGAAVARRFQSKGADPTTQALIMLAALESQATGGAVWQETGTIISPVLAGAQSLTDALGTAAGSSALSWGASTASGASSVALAGGEAEGSYDCAIGKGSVASGGSSVGGFAIGGATNTADGSFSGGSYGGAAAPASFSFNGQVTSAAGLAGAFAYFGTASGGVSVALGNASAEATNAVAIGNGSTASGSAAIALMNSTASGSNCIAIGYANTASSVAGQGLAMGALSTVTGEYAQSLGYTAAASGQYALALGYDATAAGPYSIAIGNIAANHTGTWTLGFNSGTPAGPNLSGNIDGAGTFEIALTGEFYIAGATTQTTVGATGAASALPANPLGYLVLYLGTSPGKVVIPYYNH